MKMTAINFTARDEAVKDSSIDGYFVFPQDLNTGAKKVGNYVYLLYKTNKGKPFN
jgi:ethanolamine utilization microcompartment shell protein EutL